MDSGGEPGSRGAFLIRITCARTASLFGNSRWIILTRFQFNHVARLINEEPYLGWTIADNKLTQLSSATRKRAWNGKHALHNIGNGSARLETTAARSNLFKWHYRRSQVVGKQNILSFVRNLISATSGVLFFLITRSLRMFRVYQRHNKIIRYYSPPVRFLSKIISSNFSRWE